MKVAFIIPWTMFMLFFHIIEDHSMIVSQYHEQCSYYSTMAWMLISPFTTFPFQGWIKRNLISRISKSQSFGEASIKKNSLFTLHHYSETDTYHGSLLPGKFADIQQVSLTKVKQLVNKLGGQFVPSCVHDQPCCTEQPFDSRGSGRRCEIVSLGRHSYGI